ncbi:MAG: thiosulfate oxidation carrier complex protein SoxZ [Gallionella sp.]|nr:thiosulfate oxidation carrier complex protein SoxZ [Gallionella sp.]MDD4959760.1 thiosulfate oxidation carrier complex protein SoxZ [Gallionella sp.]
MGSPMKIRAAVKDGITEVKILMGHAMETGLRKDAAGALVPAWFITEVTAKHQGKVVLEAQFGTAVSKDPYLVFRFKGGAKGEKVSVSWLDNKGDTRSDEVEITEKV